MTNLFLSNPDHQDRARGEEPSGVQPAAAGGRDEDGERVPAEAEGQQVHGRREDGQEEVPGRSQRAQADHQ